MKRIVLKKLKRYPHPFVHIGHIYNKDLNKYLKFAGKWLARLHLACIN